MKHLNQTLQCSLCLLPGDVNLLIVLPCILMLVVDILLCAHGLPFEIELSRENAVSAPASPSSRSLLETIPGWNHKSDMSSDQASRSTVYDSRHDYSILATTPILPPLLTSNEIKQEQSTRPSYSPRHFPGSYV